MAKLSLQDTNLAQLVKKANQRLRQLEKSNKTFSNAYMFVQKIEMFQSGADMSPKDKAKVRAVAHANPNAITRTQGKTVRGRVTEAGKIKFNTAISKMSKSEKANLRNLVEGFLSKGSSTVSGITKSFATAKKTYEENHPDSTITYEELSRVWALTQAQAIKKSYGSDIIVNVAETFKMGDNEAIEKFLNKYVVTKDGETVVPETPDERPVIALRTIKEDLSTFVKAEDEETPFYSIN